MQSRVYFPTTAIVSLLHALDDGDSAEIAVIGNEGVVGISLTMYQACHAMCWKGHGSRHGRFTRCVSLSSRQIGSAARTTGAAERRFAWKPT